MKLSPKQREALEWLAKEPSGRWTAPWWGGKPHIGWPKQMPARTYETLHAGHFVKLTQGERFNKTIWITQLGREAIALSADCS